jgi:hypothetical protein
MPVPAAMLAVAPARADRRLISEGSITFSLLTCQLTGYCLLPHLSSDRRGAMMGEEKQ